MATAAAHLPLTSAQSSAVERMAEAAARRNLTVFGPSSYRVPEADPGSPVWCVSSQRRNGAWHLVWVQTVEGGVQRLMCSCPARQSPRVFTCSHAQAVRLQLAAQCAAHRSRPAAYVESTVSAPGSPPAPPFPGLGSSAAVARWGIAPYCRLCGLSDITACGCPTCPHAGRSSRASEDVPAVPPDAVESLNAWIDALDAAGPLPLPADLGEPDEPGPGDDDDPDDDPDPMPPAAAAAAAARAVCPSCGQLTDAEVLRQIGTCLDCALDADNAAAAAADEAEPPTRYYACSRCNNAPIPVRSPDQYPTPACPDCGGFMSMYRADPPNPHAPGLTQAHCPRCGRPADVDDLAEHGACPRCIQRRPTLSQSTKRTPEQKAQARRAIIEAEQQRQRRYQRTGRADDPRRKEQRRERAEKADARRRERRESDGNLRADHETAILYRDNRGISPWRS